MFDFSELNAEQLEARKAGLLAEMEPEARDQLSVEDLEAKQAEVIAIDAELEARKQAHAEEQRQSLLWRLPQRRGQHHRLWRVH